MFCSANNNGTKATKISIVKPYVGQEKAKSNPDTIANSRFFFILSYNFVKNVFYFLRNKP
ncbi:hypothetical protein CAPN010_04190 [Capnocytophaga cynodegmi]|nr:hypothetical protein CAPN005_05250 [Capnocytophaga cynodegmi]GJQ06261.1 hypothetical protein CAPN010_04190 [Capnocytophaga cynodegmi]